MICACMVRQKLLQEWPHFTLVSYATVGKQNEINARKQTENERAKQKRNNNNIKKTNKVFVQYDALKNLITTYVALRHR